MKKIKFSLNHRFHNIHKTNNEQIRFPMRILLSKKIAGFTYDRVLSIYISLRNIGNI